MTSPLLNGWVQRGDPASQPLQKALAASAMCACLMSCHVRAAGPLAFGLDEMRWRDTLYHPTDTVVVTDNAQGTQAAYGAFWPKFLLSSIEDHPTSYSSHCTNLVLC